MWASVCGLFGLLCCLLDLLVLFCLGCYVLYGGKFCFRLGFD